MAEVISMPRLSDTMTDGKVSKWYKNIGDNVSEGDVLADIETDKAVQEFESEFSGTLLYIGVNEGEKSPVDQILAIIGNVGEDISALIGITANTTAEVLETVSISTNEATTNIAIATEIPDGLEIITMPRLSDTMTEGKLAKWYKKVGEKVNEGDVLADIETDKAVQEFESEFSGTLLYIGVEEASATNVDAIIAIIGPEGSDFSGLLHPIAKVNPASEVKLTIQNNVIIENPKPTIDNSNDRIAISPLAKKIAKEKGLNLNTIKGSGENGRIVKRDLENLNLTPQKNQLLQNENQKQQQEAPDFTPNSQVRNIIAKRLSESKFTAPHYYLMLEISMDKAISARAELNSTGEYKISFNDMIIKASAVALQKHQQINSSWDTDKIIHHKNINIGVAVAIEDGLVVPVLKNTNQMSYSQISASVKDLASRAKTKGLKANEMEGSTFSISNLGMFGIETFTSIINQPNSCILSVGAIIEKPVVKDGQIVVGNTMKVSLACDHRVVDGATGAQFLQTLKNYLENPMTLML